MQKKLYMGAIVWITGIYIDLGKAFNGVNRDISIPKL